MNMGGVGKDSSAGVVKPVADIAQKAAKASQIQSVKLKIKFNKGKAVKEGPDAP